MPTIKKSRPPAGTGQPLFEHKTADRFYTRICAGICWPADQPGFAVVIAEECVTPNLPARQHWLAEAEASTHNDLIRKCVELQSEYCVETWLAIEDPVADELLTIFNQRAFEDRTPSLRVGSPSNVDTRGRIAVQLNVLREALDPRRKSLSLGRESKLPGLLQQLPTLVSDVRDTDYPGPAALAYAVAELVNQPYDFEDLELTSEPEYHPLKWSARRRARR